MAAPPYLRTPILEPPSPFQMNRSRVFFESDCSSPTSWEFCSAPISSPDTIPEDTEITHFRSQGSTSSPMSTNTSGLRNSQASAPSSSSHSEIRNDGSRNSTGSSSSESQRSHDSGFLDSIETKKFRNRNSLPQNTNGENRKCRSPNSTPVSTRTHVPVSVFVNGTPGVLHRSITKTQECTHGTDGYCSSCIYQEVIVARSKPGTISPLPIETDPIPGQISSTLLGTPACASTPKKQNINPNRTSRMHKIDNFESLNKNMKSLDTNNNKSTIPCEVPSQSHHPLITSRGYSVPTINTNSKPKIQKSRSSTYYVESQPPPIPPRPKNLVPVNYHPDLNELKNSSHNNGSCSKKSSPKWQSLPRGYKRVSANSFNTSEDIIVKSHFDNDAMRLWLHELKYDAEPDCLYTLQVKSLETPSENSPQVVPCHSKSVSAPFISIRNIERIASFISEEYSFICRNLEASSFRKVPCLVLDLLDYVESFLKDLQELYGKLEKLETFLAHSCCQLRLSIIALGEDGTKPDFCTALENVHFNLDSPTGNREGLELESYFSPRSHREALLRATQRQNEKRSIIFAEIVEGVVRIGNVFSQVVDQRITRDLYSILDLIGNGGLQGRVALQIFSTILYDGGMHMCRLASGIRTVRALLSATLDSRDEFDKILCLRCLSTVLCVGEAVNDFDKAGGFEIISDILSDASLGLPLKIETVAVLTQATDPWIDLESTLCYLGIHLEKIILSLTNLIPYLQNDEDSFLLTMAAISNLTFLELSSIEFLRSYNTISLITRALKQKQSFSVFIMDQISTIFANMAGIESCRQDIVQNHGVQFLILFLQTSPSGCISQAEITASERVQQKSTIAISRLANEPGVAKMVLDMGGIQRLVQLSRTDRERNYSDGVLIACLATLRKLVSICGSEVIKELEAEELIQPRLLDSFLLFSSRQESYV